MFSFTVEVRGQDVRDKEINYNINIMDTPGLFERLIVDADTRNNELIKATISKCLEFEITKLHGLFFVCSFTGGINKEDIDSILQMNKLFAGADKAFSLLVTHCEAKMHEKRDALEAQIRKIPQLQSFFENPNVKIFFFGALSIDDMDNGAFDSVKRNLTNILVLRTALYKHIFSSSDPCHITELEFYKEQKQKVALLQQHVEEQTKQLIVYQGSEEEKNFLRSELQAKTRELREAARVINSVTGQKDLPDGLVDAVSNSEGLTEEAKTEEVVVAATAN